MMRQRHYKDQLGHLLKHLKSGAGLRAQLARGALRGLIVTLLGIGVGFLVQVAIARLLGVNEFGVYAWVLAWINFLVMISCSGLEGLVVRQLPAYLIDRRWERVRGFLCFRFVGWAVARYSVAWVCMASHGYRRSASCPVR